MYRTERTVITILLILTIIFGIALNISLRKLVRISEQTLKYSQPEQIRVIPENYVLEREK